MAVPDRIPKKESGVKIWMACIAVFLAWLLGGVSSKPFWDFLYATFSKDEGISAYLQPADSHPRGPAKRESNQAATNPSPSPKCLETDFAKTHEGWDFTLYDEAGGGYFSPKPSTSYWSPPIWLVPHIPTFFAKAVLKAELRSKDGRSPKLVIFMGKKPQIATFLVGDGNRQSVAFERVVPTSDGYAWERVTPASVLDHPIREGTSALFTLKATREEPSTIRYDLTVRYLWGDEAKWEEDDFSYRVRLLDADPGLGGDYSETRYGFGVANWASIRPILFQLCPW